MQIYYYYSINSSDDNTSPGPSKRPKLCAIETYRRYLISTYNVRQLPADERCPLGCVKQFINLTIVDNRDRSEFQKHEVRGKIDLVDKGPVYIEQIACKFGNSFPKLVIIEGAPGVGKTTLSWELCRQWSLDQIWRDYSLVVLLRLRDKCTHEANNLVDLFECGDEATSQRVKEELLITQGKKLLFILEGLDEFPQELRETKDSCIIMKLIHGKLLPASAVVITSRPWALDSLKKCSSRIDQKIVVLGFTEKQIQEYIDQAIKDGAPDGLRAYIAANPHINSAMYNPLYARIVVQVYIECHARKQNVFPNTTTELYTLYSSVLLKRYLTDHPVQEKWNGELHELPQSLQPHFLHLCEVAHKGIVLKEHQLIFYEDDIPEGSTTLGFMNSVHPLYQSITQTASPSYNFIHLTLQEFLAAFHIWRTYPQQEQLFFIETHSNYYNMITLFLAGLTKLSDPWTKCILPAPRVRSSDKEVVLYLHRKHILWLYETQNEQLISSFDNVVLPIKLTESQLDPLYFLALGYCIAVGKFMLELKVIFPDEERGDILNQNHLHLLAELKRHNSKCSSQVKVLDMSSNSVCPFPDSVYKIVNYIPAATQGALHVRDGDHVPLASKLAKFLENVETVTILLPDSLEVLKYSRTLKILYCYIDDSEIAGILNETITTFCTSLEYLEVRVAIRVDDDTNDESQYLIFGLNIKRFKELKRCQLFPLNFGPIFTKELTEQANKFNSHFADFLTYFKLIGDTLLPTLGLKHLFSHSLSKCSQLETLSIDFSYDKIIVLKNIFKALGENSSVKQLSCKLDESTLHQIINEFCTLLQQNSFLEEIYIEVDCSVTNPTPILKIMEVVCSLMLNKIVIRPYPVIASNDTIVAICNIIENNMYLEYLHLPTLYMESDQRFLLPIANALSKNSSLETLVLDFEATTTQRSKPHYMLYKWLFINSEDCTAVGDMLKVNKTLCVLHLMVDIPDWSPIIEGLKLNTTIRELHIPSSARKSAIKCTDYVHVRSRIKYPRD